MNSPSPPAYSPPKTPAYTAEPRASETLLSVTSSRGGGRSPPTRTFTWSSPSMTMSIAGKDEGLESPVYGTSGLIRAEVGLHDLSAIVSVTVLVHGSIALVDYSKALTLR